MEKAMKANDDTSLGDVLVFGALGPIFGLAYLGHKTCHAIKMRAAKRRADNLAAEQRARRQAAAAKRKAPRRPVTRKVRRIRTARDHRIVYGVAPAIRVINGGKA